MASILTDELGNVGNSPSGTRARSESVQSEKRKEDELNIQVKLQFDELGEEALKKAKPKSSEDGELLDSLTTATGQALDIEARLMRANALQSYDIEAPSKLKLPRLVPPEKHAKNKSDSDTSDKPRRFFRLARMVKTNLLWTRDMHDKYEEESSFTVSSDNTSLTFNVNNFKLTKMSYGGLSTRIQKILAKHPMDRTSGDIHVLKDVVTRLQCFDKYSTEVKQELARIIFYESFEEGRVVIQQGHIGVSFYFIVVGRVNVKFAEVDKVTGVKKILHLGELSAGSSFGELALLHNIRRTATIVCAVHCEFLRVDKADFEAVLMAVSKKEYQRRLNILHILDCFKDWTDEEISNCNQFCRIVEYQPNTVILSEGVQKDDFVLFIVTGECYIVRELLLIREDLSFVGTRLRLPTKEQLKKFYSIEKAWSQRNRRAGLFGTMMERHFWAMCSFGRYNYFGVGESLKKTSYVSKTKVEVLLVPKVSFSKLGRSKTLDLMQENLIKCFPEDDVLYDNYIADLKWRKYKSKVVEEVVKRRRKKNNTDLEDVPMSIRLEQQEDERILRNN